MKRSIAGTSGHHEDIPSHMTCSFTVSRLPDKTRFSCRRDGPSVDPSRSSAKLVRGFLFFLRQEMRIRSYFTDQHHPTHTSFRVYLRCTLRSDIKTKKIRKSENPSRLSPVGKTVRVHTFSRDTNSAKHDAQIRPVADREQPTTALRSSSRLEVSGNSTATSPEQSISGLELSYVLHRPSLCYAQ